MHGAGFEPAHPEIVGLKSTALDHSAIRAITFFYFYFFRGSKARYYPPMYILQTLFKSYFLNNTYWC
jgi:hypothetical protein